GAGRVAAGLDSGAAALASTGAGAAATDAPSTSKVTSAAPTAAICPGSPWIEATTPATGEVISTVALSVMTSTSGWSSATLSPGLTCQPTISASAVPSPTSGRRKT